MKNKLLKKRSTNYKQKFNQQAPTMSVKRSQLEEEAQKLKSERSFLSETLHEVRKINKEIKASSDQLSEALLHLDLGEKKNEIENIRKNIRSNTELLSIRMNAYDMFYSPEIYSKELPLDIQIYPCVEKVYKCLHSARKAKNIDIKLIGESRHSYSMNSSIELGFFIILENAIKYSPINSRVNVNFIDDHENLVLKITNWGLKLDEGEIDHLTERGFRGRSAQNINSAEGSGLGLYLLKSICEMNNVNYSFYTTEDRRAFDGLNYYPFTVRLEFNDF